MHRHVEINRARGWVKMFGSLYCTHWTWEKLSCGPSLLIQRQDGENSIILEVVATRNLWIWYAFIGV